MEITDLTKYSQAGQDFFAVDVCQVKSYIEVGANRPIKFNNTYILETKYQWRGFSIELETNYKKLWDECSERQNKILWSNALNLNYKKTLENLNLPLHVGYLSCDLEPASVTFEALKKIINEGIQFDCITFEHDYYRNKKDFDLQARNFLESKGYKVAVYDVYAYKKNKMFETWFVNHSINFDMISFDEWKENIIKKY